MPPPKGTAIKQKHPNRIMQGHRGDIRNRCSPPINTMPPPQRKRRYHRDIGVRCPPKVREDTTRTTKNDAPPPNEKRIPREDRNTMPPTNRKEIRREYRNTMPPPSGKGILRDHRNTMATPQRKRATAGTLEYDDPSQSKRGYRGKTETRCLPSTEKGTHRGCHGNIGIRCFPPQRKT